MKKLEIHLTDRAHERIRTAFMLRKMSDNAHGPVDLLVAMILDSIERGEAVRTVRTKEDTE